MGADALVIERKRSLQKRRDRLVRAARNSAVDGYARVRERRFGAAAHAAADEHVRAVIAEKLRQRAVTCAFGVHHARGDYPAVFRLIKFEFFRAPEVRENFAVVECCRNYHFITSFAPFAQRTYYIPF